MLAFFRLVSYTKNSVAPAEDFCRSGSGGTGGRKSRGGELLSAPALIKYFFSIIKNFVKAILINNDG